ncbi:AraC family transcriptional regulator [Hahella chejuensis]|uniref:AraC family transcriptional regulator n=1 Tax=Hahella chejuensis TaxID=158327 RepID=UPI000324154B|nr:AraC family transcriptional regulator [Hahella chejuensis]
MKEYSRLWESSRVQGVELLSAAFNHFSFSKHWHDQLAVGVILQGAEGLDYRGGKAVIPRGQIVAINPAEPHTGFAASEGGWRYRMFYFEEAILRETLRENRNGFAPFLRGPVIDDPATFSLLLELHQALEAESFSLAQDSLLTAALHQLFQRHGDGGEVETKGAQDLQGCLRIRDYLHDNWRRNVALEELAGLTGMSRFQLIRAFKQRFALTPHQFLILLKTREAKRLLESGMEPLTAALECGFFDQSHLHRNFKRVYGVTPGRFAKRNFIQEPQSPFVID